MSFAALATPLTLLAVALPFLFCFTQPPLTNFWPLLASGGCAAVLIWLALVRRSQQLHRGEAGPCAPSRGVFPSGAVVSSEHLALGLVCACVAASVIGLLQYFLGDPGIVGVQPSTPGQSIGNLRQRNQQASLLSMGVWSVLWWVGRGSMPQGWQGWRVATAWMAGGVLVLLAVGSAATASRTGGMQWLLVVGLACFWPAARHLALAALALYGLAAWALPVLLEIASGVVSEGLFTRLAGEQLDCTSRTVLWSNVAHLIAQKPWAGWGWGELDYAHYVTLFPGKRFCVLLDNAHNLPLQLAVELGLPTALVLCGGALVGVIRSAPWREHHPSRQLAWGLLAIIGVHSLLEFPLWYGPFQLVAALSLLLLCPASLPRWLGERTVRAVLAGATVAAVLMGGYVGWDFYRVSQLYQPASERPEYLKDDTARKVGTTPFFKDQVDFAALTTTGLTRANAGWVFAVAGQLLHFSPEPRVIESLIESAVLLGKDDVAAYHIKRYRIAYPDSYARWKGAAGGGLVAASASTPKVRGASDVSDVLEVLDVSEVSEVSEGPARPKKATTDGR